MAIPSSIKGGMSRLGLIIAVLAAVLAAVYAAQPPSPVPADAPPAEFSAERAVQHIRLFAVEPHPAGTPAADRVLEYILGALAEMGVRAEVDTAIVAERSTISEVRNVLARIPGTANTKAFALVAHYDSTPYGPGAADAGSGVATMLETARAIKAGPPLKNDVMLVFTDGEERGLTGARAFVRHPWAEEVGVLLNMETRGTSGPASMFETTPKNGWLIRQLIDSGASVRASSLSYDIYKHMPTKTDLTVLRRHRLKGYNIAFIEDFPYYHTPNDNPDNLSLGSLQHNGSYALNLARHLGNMPLDNIPREPDTVFFNVFGPIMVQYPASLGWPFAIFAGLTFFAVVTFGLRRGALTFRGIRGGSRAVLAAAGLATIISAAIIIILYRLHYVYVLYDTPTLASALIVITVLVAGVVFQGYKKVATADLVSGVLVCWLAVLVVLQIALPHGACVALWPMLAGVIGLILLIAGPAEPSGRRTWFHALSALPGILVGVQFMRGMTTSMTALMSPVLMAPLVVFLGLLAPQIRYILKPVPARALILLIAFLSILVLVTTGGAHGPDTPVMNSVSYGFDRTTGQAWWISTDKTPDEWTSQFFPPGTKKRSVREFAPFDRARRLKAPAPVVELVPPTIDVISDVRRDNGVRNVSLRLASPRRVPEIRFYIDAPTRVLQATVDGRQLRLQPSSSSRGGWWFHYGIFPRAGKATIDLIIEGEGTVAGRVLEKSYDLPPLPYTPRPPYMINKSNSLDWFEKNKLTSGHSYVVTPFSF